MEADENVQIDDNDAKALAKDLVEIDEDEAIAWIAENPRGAYLKYLVLKLKYDQLEAAAEELSNVTMRAIATVDPSASIAALGAGNGV